MRRYTFPQVSLLIWSHVLWKSILLKLIQLLFCFWMLSLHEFGQIEKWWPHFFHFHGQLLNFFVLFICNFFCLLYDNCLLGCHLLKSSVSIINLKERIFLLWKHDSIKLFQKSSLKGCNTIFKHLAPFFIKSFDQSLDLNTEIFL